MPLRVIGLLLFVVACSPPAELSLDSTCREFLDASPGERAELLTELARGRSGDHGPLGVAKLLDQAQQECEREPDTRLKDTRALRTP